MTRGLLPFGDGVSLGTGITSVEITPSIGVNMPADAKMLLGVIPELADVTNTTVQSISASLDLQSSDIRNITPYTVLFPPVGAGLSTVFNTLEGKEYWPINAPLYGGETLHAFGRALVANTSAPIAMGWLDISNNPRDYDPSNPRYFAKLGSLTASGVIANQNQDTPGTPYSITGAKAIAELFGLFHFKTIAAGDALLGQIKFNSSEFQDSWTHYVPLYPNSYGLGGTGSMLIPGVSRQKVNIPVKRSVNQTNIQDNLRASLLPASAGSWISGVMYV